MKVLVTGATGFLGAHTAEFLKRQGCEVWAQGRNLAKGQHLTDRGFHFWAGDLADAQRVKQLPLDFDAVVHCAALSSPWGTYAEFESANVTATTHLLQHFSHQPQRPRVVYISSPSIYIEPRDRLSICESDALPQVSINAYIATKKEAERVVDRFRPHYEHLVTLRPQGIVGPGDNAIFPRILRAAQKGIVPRIGKGTVWMDLTYVANVVDAIWLGLNARPEARQGIYNISNGQPIDLHQTIDQVLRELRVAFRWKKISFRKAYRLGQILEWLGHNILGGREPVLTRYTACVLGLSRTLNIDLAKQQLGYEPRVSMESAMKIVIQSLHEKAHG